MGVESAIAQIVSDMTQASYKTRLVFGNLANRRYEGQVSKGGSVKIITVGTPSARAYTSSDITWDEVDVAGRVLTIDQDYYTTQSFEDKDKVQATPDLMADIGTEMGYSLAKNVDAYMAGLYGSAGVKSGTTGSPISITSANVLEYFQTIAAGLADNDTPDDGLVAVIPNWLHTKLVLAKALTYDTNGTFMTGMVGECAGFRVFKSNQVSHSGTTWYAPMFFRAGDTMALAEQIMTDEVVRRENRFADGMRARVVYGAKVVRPEALGVLYCAAGSET